MNSPRALRKQQGGEDAHAPESARKKVNQEPSPPIAALDEATIASSAQTGAYDVDDNGSIDYDDI